MTGSQAIKALYTMYVQGPAHFRTGRAIKLFFITSDSIAQNGLAQIVVEVDAPVGVAVEPAKGRSVVDELWLLCHLSTPNRSFRAVAIGQGRRRRDH